jgi:hypothetical protein
MYSQALRMLVLTATVVGLITVPAATALAGPEFFKNGAALAAGEAIEYNSTNAGTVIEALGGQSVKCPAGSAKGKTNGPTKVQLVKLKFTGCEGTVLAVKVKCTSPGLAAGEIITESLRGKLGFLKSGGVRPAGVSLEPENGTMRFTAFKCGIEGEIVVFGQAVGEVPTTPMDQTTWEAIFAPNATNTAERWIQFEEEGGTFTLRAGCRTVVLKDKEEMTWVNNEKLKIQGS